MIQGPTSLVVRQAKHATFRALVAEKPAVLLVRQGEKRVERKGQGLLIGARQLAVLPATSR